MITESIFRIWVCSTCSSPSAHSPPSATPCARSDPHNEQHRTDLCAVLFVALGIIRQTEDVVHGYLIEIGQAYENISGNVPLAQLVVAVDLMGAVELFGQMTLLQILVLPQIADSLVHGITSWVGYHTAFCCIDKYRKML